MTALLFWIIIVGGFYIFRGGLAVRQRPAQIVLMLLGAIIVVGSAWYFGRGIDRVSHLLRFVLSVTALVSAVHVVFGQRPVQCALSLLAVFLSLAGIFVAYQAEFLGVITLAINAGGVIVTFLFILMLIDLRMEGPRPVAARWTWGAVVAGFLLAVGLLAVVSGSSGQVAASPPPRYFEITSRYAYGVGEGMDTRMGEMSEEEARAISAGDVHPLRPITGFTQHVGWELYTRYTVPFEVASLILTVAVVGAVCVGRQRASGESKKSGTYTKAASGTGTGGREGDNRP